MREDPGFLAMRIPVDVEISLGFVSLNIRIYGICECCGVYQQSPPEKQNQKDAERSRLEETDDKNWLT